MIQQLSHSAGLHIRFDKPAILSRLPRRHSACASRNSMQNRPQDFCGWLWAGVRSVQHLNPLFGDQNIAQPALPVTLRQPRNRQCLISTHRS